MFIMFNPPTPASHRGSAPEEPAKRASWHVNPQPVLRWAGWCLFVFLGLQYVLRWAGWFGKICLFLRASSGSAIGWLVWQNLLCFLRASVGDVKHFGFGRFGTAPESSGSAMGSVGDARHFGFGRFGTAPESSGSAMGWLVWQNLFVFLGLQ